MKEKELDLALDLAKRVTPPELGFVGRLGGIITAVSNKRVQVLGDLNPDDFDIRDIAHALSNLCRFGGHTSEFYSVAQHSVLCYRWVIEELKSRDDLNPDLQDKILRHALLHDASEAYLVDVPRPIKRAPGFEGYLQAESDLEAALAKRFDLYLYMPDLVKQADLVMLVTEKRDLFQENPDAQLYWPKGIDPMDEIITPWNPDRACEEFVACLRELKLFPFKH